MNIANHNYRFGDSQTQGEFYKAMRSSCSEGPVKFFFKTPISMLVRGGLLGSIQLGVYKTLVDIIDLPSLTLNGVTFKKDKQQNEKAREFIEQL